MPYLWFPLLSGRRNGKKVAVAGDDKAERDESAVGIWESASVNVRKSGFIDRGESERCGAVEVGDAARYQA